MYSRSVSRGVTGTKTTRRHRPRPAPGQVVFRPRACRPRGAEEADVEVVAGVLEVVRVAAEEGDVALWREDQPDVRVFLGPIQVVAGALESVTTSLPQARTLLRLLLDVFMTAAGPLARRPVPHRASRPPPPAPSTSSMSTRTFSPGPRTSPPAPRLRVKPPLMRSRSGVESFAGRPRRRGGWSSPSRRPRRTTRPARC